MASRSHLTEPEKKACIELSRLFLDTEKTANEIDNLTASLHPLGVPVDILDRMLREDIFPVLYRNLISTVGAWEGFDENWLLGQIETRRATNPGWLKGLGDSAAWLMVGGMVRSPWGQVKRRLQSKL